MRKPVGFTLIVFSLLIASCNTNMFDENTYNEIMERAQPVDSIDKDHTWDLTSPYYMTADIPATATDVSKLLILSGNPAAGDETTILGDYPATAGEKKYFSFTAPNYYKSFYAALVDTDGRYTLIAFTPSSQRTLGFTQPLTTTAVDSRRLSRQTFSYCFEDEIPEPGDYDYNDLVLRISHERTAANQITLDVTLAAVGSMGQVAAAIRLVGYKFDDIESVTTVDNENFNKGYKKSALPFIDSDDLLTRGNDDEAVLNLFEDAHWATGVATYASEGYLPRFKYNVSKTTGGDYEMMAPRTVSYVVTFKNPQQLDYFTFDQLDPFAIVEYNSALMEVHAVYAHRNAAVLHDYVQATSTSILPWGLTIPMGSFRYPLDGTHIGFAKDNALFGAYMTGNHAFGEWAANHEKATDWYHYPTGNMVY